jgi:hypothetical protein
MWTGSDLGQKLTLVRATVRSIIKLGTRKSMARLRLSRFKTIDF